MKNYTARDEFLQAFGSSRTHWFSTDEEKAVFAVVVAAAIFIGMTIGYCLGHIAKSRSPNGSISA